MAKLHHNQSIKEDYKQNIDLTKLLLNCAFKSQIIILTKSELNGEEFGEFFGFNSFLVVNTKVLPMNVKSLFEYFIDSFREKGIFDFVNWQ